MVLFTIDSIKSYKKMLDELRTYRQKNIIIDDVVVCIGEANSEFNYPIVIPYQIKALNISGYFDQKIIIPKSAEYIKMRSDLKCKLIIPNGAIDVYNDAIGEKNIRIPKSVLFYALNKCKNSFDRKYIPKRFVDISPYSEWCKFIDKKFMSENYYSAQCYIYC